MIVVQVVWLHYQPINMTKLDAIYYACDIWQLFLVGGEGKAGIVFWYLHFHDHYLISRNYFIIIVITGVHCSVRRQGRVVCGKHTKFPSEQTRKKQQTIKKTILGWQAVQVVYNAMETSAVHFEVDTGHWTGCAMQEDTSQEKSAVDFVDNKWTSSTQLLVTFLQSSVDNNTVFF